MEIILIEDIRKLGAAGDVVKVANGFARNYLLPQKFAILSTPYNRKKIEAIKNEADKKREYALEKLKKLATDVNGITLEFKRRVDDKGSLFGSVSETDIVTELLEKGFEINKSYINLEKVYKELGTFDLELKFNSELKADIKIAIESE